MAADLLQLRGYAGVGLAEILALSEATKSSLYFHFPGGKEDLAAAALRLRGDEIARLIEQLIETAPDAATAVTAFAVALASRLEDSEFQRGCALATALLDAGPDAEKVQDAALSGYDRWVSLLADKIRAEGVVDDPDTEALLVVSALEGALILGRARRSIGPVLAVSRRITGSWTRSR
ncbi:TetR/AcrR family transcriptional regulator [Nocardia sp. NPDC058379]|uniref:TetR/AcrR family transcriptional regulator n=1 Tax=unclassified Nocardia TaxID=2637762 RepID=UPI00364BDFE8